MKRAALLAALLFATGAQAQTYPLTQTPVLPPVPGTIRATCTITSFDSSGNGSCTLANFTGGVAFTSMPDCIAELSYSGTGYVFAFPNVTPSLTSVAVNEQAAQKALNIALGATTIWTTPPSGTSLTIVCRGS